MHKKKTLHDYFTPVLDFFIAHCTGISVLYSKLSFKFFKLDKRFVALKNKYEGKRCFIVALGPSLTINDLNKLAKNGEYCFSMNRCYQLFNKTDWRPDCYFISDGRVNTMETQCAIKEMIKDNIPVIYSRREIKKMPKEAMYYRADYIDFIFANSSAMKYKRKGHYSRFSTDAGSFVYSGHSCVTSILQIAYYLGFNEVYLLGQDCGVSKGMDHSKGINAPANPHQSDDLKHVILDFESINQDIKEKGIDFKVYNATRGGALEVFPRVDLDVLLS